MPIELTILYFYDLITLKFTGGELKMLHSKASDQRVLLFPIAIPPECLGGPTAFCLVCEHTVGVYYDDVAGMILSVPHDRYGVTIPAEDVSAYGCEGSIKEIEPEPDGFVEM